jgi:lipopolysaccharide transport system permease protein
VILNLHRYRHYILRNAWLELRHRYAGSSLGTLWNVLLPLAEVAIYATVFAQVMGLRMPGQANSRFAFVLYLCSGIFPWAAFSKVVAEGSNAFLANARYLTQLAIPEEVFVAREAVSETMTLMIYLAMLVIFGPLLGQPPGWANLLLPLVGLLFLLFAFGLALLLASLRVFFRDVGQVVGIMLRMWMWLSPVVWVQTALPPKALAVLRWNPIFAYLISFRDLFLRNQVPAWTTWVTMIAWAVGFTALGYAVLRRLRPELRDLI